MVLSVPAADLLITHFAAEKQDGQLAHKGFGVPPAHGNTGVSARATREPRFFQVRGEQEETKRDQETDCCTQPKEIY